jgi:hypothetical protein
MCTPNYDFEYIFADLFFAAWPYSFTAGTILLFQS